MAEHEPHGKKPTDPGAKFDAGKIRMGLVIHGFPNALREVGRVATYGAAKYSPNGWRHVPDGVERYTDAMYRHLLQEAAGDEIDAESELMHAAMAAWNALARLELRLLKWRGPEEEQ